MNLFACLGVGPGHRLLLGPMGEDVGYTGDDSLLGLGPRTDDSGRPVAARQVRTRRTRAESEALCQRVEAALGRKDSHDAIALREGIHRTYVAYIAAKLSLTATRRTPEQIDQLVIDARRMLGRNPAMNQKTAAELLGVSESYLCVLLADRP